MSTKVLVAALACLIPCLSVAQQSTPQASAQAQGSASGSVSKGDKSVSADSSAGTNAELSGTLDAKKAKPGDPVTAKTTEPSTTADHQQLPKGTKLLGHVTEAKAAGKGESQSTLGFVFDRAVLKDGREIPINTTVRALAAAEGAANTSGGDAVGAGGAAMSGVQGGGGGRVGGGGLGGAVGGLGASAGGTLGGVAGGAGRMAGGASGAVGSTVGASGHALAGGAGAVGGVNAQGLLSAGSQGVFGMQGVSLAQNASGAGSVVTSAGKTVRLESGTRMLLSVEGSATRSSSPPAQ
jgi:hypothetical protein